MKYAFLCMVFILIIIGSVVAADFKTYAAKTAQKDYESKVETAQKKYNRKIRMAQKAYAKKLEAALKTTMKKGNLEEANLIKKEIDKVEEELEKTKPKIKSKPKKKKIKHPDAIKFNGHYYKPFWENMSWSEAQEKCKKLGGYLVCIENKNENRFILRLILNNNHSDTWIGAKYSLKTNKWEWANSDKPIHNNWSKSWPKPGDTCARIWKTGQWASSGNTLPYIEGFICEWEK